MTARKAAYRTLIGIGLSFVGIVAYAGLAHVIASLFVWSPLGFFCLVCGAAALFALPTIVTYAGARTVCKLIFVAKHDNRGRRVPADRPTIREQFLSALIATAFGAASTLPIVLLLLSSYDPKDGEAADFAHLLQGCYCGALGAALAYFWLSDLRRWIVQSGEWPRR